MLIGSEDEMETYYPAIVGFDPESGRFLYDYDLLVQAFAESFDDGTSEDPETDAVEWIDYNVVRALPYYGERAPMILYRDYDDGTVRDMAGDQEPVDDRLRKIYEDGMSSIESESKEKQ